MAHFEVHTSEYRGDGHWVDYPHTFKLEDRNDMVLFCTKVRIVGASNVRSVFLVTDDNNYIQLNRSDYDTITGE